MYLTIGLVIWTLLILVILKSDVKSVLIGYGIFYLIIVLFFFNILVIKGGRLKCIYLNPFVPDFDILLFDIEKVHMSKYDTGRGRANNIDVYFKTGERRSILNQLTRHELKSLCSELQRNNVCVKSIGINLD